MSGPAQVRSTDAIEALAVALARFEERVSAALDSLDVDLRRAGDWVEHDRPVYWRNQLREAEQQLHDAKMELERCLLMTVVEGQRPACREQKAAVAQSKVRLEYCREKADRVKKWQRDYRHESMEFHGRVGQLRRLAEQDVPSARILLGKLLARIDEYQIEKAPAAFTPPEAATPTPADSMTRTPPPRPVAAANSDSDPDAERDA
jgi:hypothetical protein